MARLSDASLRHVLEPAVAVMGAFRQASSWRAVKAAWGASKRCDRGGFMGLTALFIVMGVGCVWLNNPYLFGLAFVSGVAGVLLFRYRIIDRHPLRDTYGSLDRYFGLNYRFRRYLMFRDALQRAGIDPDTINRVRKILVAEARLHESRQPQPGFVVTAVISVVASLLVILSTREYLLQSGWTLLILFACLVGLHAYFLWKSAFPGHQHAEQELECFLIWHEEEYAWAARA